MCAVLYSIILYENSLEYCKLGCSREDSKSTVSRARVPPASRFFFLLLFFLAYDTVFCLLDDRRNDAR